MVGRADVNVSRGHVATGEAVCVRTNGVVARIAREVLVGPPDEHSCVEGRVERAEYVCRA